MRFEYEFKLKNGRKVFVEGEAVIDYRCDCCGMDHISRVDYDQIIDESTSLDVQLDDQVMVEIEAEVDGRIYDALARQERDYDEAV